ncbi:hypothetical protein [Dyadobacter psychrophilus]|uniref:Uncharacterized protein n=1 Tax=Dyadobacter psychrophilus TaxID=651661 RepID=A0A1T5C901_9BACT|nr:hypothetical protein [Dyadobacter psychrophilus]SKB55879.1 hypothetical protein SAMN05660293_01009 [Dyadobacter psychrophilus]
MKMKQAFLLLSVCLLASCGEVVNPLIRTVYLTEGDRTSQRLEAIAKLYEFYNDSDKDREAYEVISKRSGDFIVNYVPGLGLLTLCGEPGFGWSKQFIDVDSTLLRKLVDRGATFDDLNTGKFDSLLVTKTPVFRVNTNGKPF